MLLYVCCCFCYCYNVVKLCDSDKIIVGMVGDGVNDGLVFVVVNIGIVMGVGGMVLVVEVVDVVLMSNNLMKILELV